MPSPARALGFEAASRGAAEVVLLERDPALVASLVATKGAAAGDGDPGRRADALQWLARAPERASIWSSSTRRSIRRCSRRAVPSAARMVAPGGFVYVSRRRRWPRPLASAGLAPFRSARAGAALALWRRADEP
jgi:hypothetical protein